MVIVVDVFAFLCRRGYCAVGGEEMCGGGWTRGVHERRKGGEGGELEGRWKIYG